MTVPLPTEALLRFCVTWNTNSRHCHEAQAVLGVLLRHEAPDELLTYDGVRASLEGLLPYTGEWAGLGAGRAVRHTRPPLTACGPPPERHFQRLSRMYVLKAPCPSPSNSYPRLSSQGFCVFHKKPNGWRSPKLYLKSGRW